jgi:hypothetical protein
LIQAVELDVAPFDVPYEPGAHWLQDSAPAFGEYAPAVQDVHEDAFPMEKDPARHTVQLGLRAALAVPGKQGMQSCREVAPTYGPNVPLGQDMHMDAFVAPTTVEYVPSGHGVQDACPELVPKVPAAHGEQTLAPNPLYAPTGQAEQGGPPLLIKPAVHVAQDAPPCPGGHCMQIDVPANRNTPSEQIGEDSIVATKTSGA